MHYNMFSLTAKSGEKHFSSLARRSACETDKQLIPIILIPRHMEHHISTGKSISIITKRLTVFQYSLFFSARKITIHYQSILKILSQQYSDNMHYIQIAARNIPDDPVNGVYILMSSKEVPPVDGMCSSFCGEHTFSSCFRGHSLLF